MLKENKLIKGPRLVVQNHNRDPPYAWTPIFHDNAKFFPTFKDNP